VWAAFDRVLMPTVRWYIRRKINHAISQVNTRLRLTMRPFHLTKRQVLIDRLVYDPQVLQATREHAEAEGLAEEIVQSKVIQYAKEIVPAFNAYIYFRFGYWLNRKLSKLLYRVRVKLLDEKLVENIDPEATVVFVMNHRSNMDYILLSYLVNKQSTISYAVGEWAQVWPLNALIRAMGAFFVRRNSNNPLYRQVLQRYIHMATKEGVAQAVFLEGALTRDGKMREPKFGFLNYMLKHYDPNTDRDIVFVPIGLNYDRIIEDENLTKKRDPDRPRPTKFQMFKATLRFYFKHLAGGTRKRQRRFGYVGVNFGRPLSIHQFCDQKNIDFHAMEHDERFQATEQLASHLMDEITHVIPILPVPLIANIFRNTTEQSLTAFEIKSKTLHLIQTLQDQGAPIRDNEKPQEQTIQRALDQMVHHQILKEQNKDYSQNPQKSNLLNYYANSLAHWNTE
jgi:glycerol-3-phosphate O-acyltransferase